MKEIMKIGKIDKDFVDIINYLNTEGFKPFSSCDGVLKNHSDPRDVTSAYIAFLKSPQIIDLMAAFLRDKVSFSNKSGNLTSYFEKIIKHIAEGKISIPDDEKKDLNTISEILEDDENSDLELSVTFNSKYQPYMEKEGQINVLRIRTKEGCGYYRNMHSLMDILHEKYGVAKKIDSINETFEEDEFAVSFIDGSTGEVYFTNEHIKEVQGLIKEVKELGNVLPTFEIKEFDYDFDDEDILYPN